MGVLATKDFVPKDALANFAMVGELALSAMQVRIGV